MAWTTPRLHSGMQCLQPHPQLWPLAHCPPAQHETQLSMRRPQSDPIFCPINYKPISFDPPQRTGKSLRCPGPGLGGESPGTTQIWALLLKTTTTIIGQKRATKMTIIRGSVFTITSNTHGCLQAGIIFIPISQTRKPRLKGQVICQMSCQSDSKAQAPIH